MAVPDVYVRDTEAEGERWIEREKRQFFVSIISGEQQSRAPPTKLGLCSIRACKRPVFTVSRSIAAGIALDQQRDGRSPLRVTHWRAANSRDTKLSCVYDSDPRGRPQPRILIIPPTLVDLPDPDVPTGVASWLRSQHAGGAKLVSVCSGAFILAETGLVAGRSVSTHRICAEALAKRFPEIAVDANQRIIDHGDIITAGGFLAWVDVGLLLVDRMLGGAVRAEAARFILSDSAAREARYFAGFAPRQTHEDTAVLKAQEWVHIRDGQTSLSPAWRQRRDWKGARSSAGSRMQRA